MALSNRDCGGFLGSLNGAYENLTSAVERLDRECVLSVYGALRLFESGIAVAPAEEGRAIDFHL